MSDWRNTVDYSYTDTLNASQRARLFLGRPNNLALLKVVSEEQRLSGGGYPEILLLPEGR